jgi:hypothetical protein
VLETPCIHPPLSTKTAAFLLWCAVTSVPDNFTVVFDTPNQYYIHRQEHDLRLDGNGPEGTYQALDKPHPKGGKMIFIIFIMVPVVLLCLFGVKALYYAGALVALLYAAAIIAARRSPAKSSPGATSQDYFSNPNPD